MLNAIVDASLRFKVLVLVAFAVLVGLGVMAYRQVPVDAFPDVTNIQVEVVSTAAGMSPLAASRPPNSNNKSARCGSSWVRRWSARVTSVAKERGDKERAIEAANATATQTSELLRQHTQRVAQLVATS